jgi:hypothetical protein
VLNSEQLSIKKSTHRTYSLIEKFIGSAGENDTETPLDLFNLNAPGRSITGINRSIQQK